MNSSSVTNRARPPIAKKAPPMMSQYVRSACTARLRLPEPPQTMAGMISVMTNTAPSVFNAAKR